MGNLDWRSEIEYVESEKGLVLTSYKGLNEQVMLPDDIDGIPIVEIGSYAFANRPDITEIRIPFGVCEIGKYAFYRCRNLRRLILSNEILEIGGGALTGCRGIQEVDIYLKKGEQTALKSILDEVRFQVHARLYMGEHIADILFPEHYEEAVEDTPAKQLFTRYHGAGGDYRQCFYNRELDYKKYDEVLYRAVAEDTVETVVRMAMGRLKYPYKLSAQARNTYETYIGNHLIETYLLYVEEDNVEMLRFLVDNKYVSEEALLLGIERAGNERKTEILSFLMDEKRMLYPKKKKTFDL